MNDALFYARQGRIRDYMQRAVFTPAAVATLTLEHLFDSQSDDVLCLRAAASWTASAGAELPIEQYIFLCAEGETYVTSRRLKANRTAPVNSSQDCDWQGEVYVPRKWRIGLRAMFNGAAQTKQAELYLCGVVVPRGNLLI